jgi:hypothetical protein
MREFKFFQKNKHATHVAVLTARHETFVNWKRNNFPGANHSASSFSSNGTYYYMVNGMNRISGWVFDTHDSHEINEYMNRISGWVFDTYIELHDSHEINEYIDVIRNLNQRRLL